MVDEAASRLGLKPDYRRDNGRLLTECASWVGTPYRYGGNTKAGVDCSALTLHIYNKVYGKKLHRRSRDQFEKDVRRIARSDMQQGDLVFFTSPRSGGHCGHVGIYLRDGYFLHASSSRGVVVSHLDGKYYQQHWLGAGRVPDDDLHNPDDALP
ncbi:MAG: C40 family peptidase [Alloprevotella sp.]|nr:C40 family peptidase [Alloprevotella sp.]MBR1651940.1 C40 family peptidase [Alloprevotella sp.]